MLEANFGYSFRNSVGSGCKRSECVSLLCEILTKLTKLALRFRRDEILKLLEPMGRRMLEVLLAQRTLRAFTDDREGLARIGLLLRKLPGLSIGPRRYRAANLPEMSPHAASLPPRFFACPPL
jgi:hypothetical protein